MTAVNDEGDFVILGGDNKLDFENQVLEWLEREDADECIERIIIETLAEIKIWKYRQNPETPLRRIVLNRNLYNRVAKFTDL
jgi:hypothetical protein